MAQVNGGYVVDAARPGHQGAPRGQGGACGKGDRIVYVGHEGHVGGRRHHGRAPDAVDRVESVTEVGELPSSTSWWRCSPQTIRSDRERADVLEANPGRFPEMLGAWCSTSASANHQIRQSA